MTYAISTYRPGYLPENEPHVTESLDIAISVFLEDIRKTIDDIEDDDDFLSADTALHIANLDIKAREAIKASGYFYYDVAGYRHAVEVF